MYFIPFEMHNPVMYSLNTLLVVI